MLTSQKLLLACLLLDLHLHRWIARMASHRQLPELCCPSLFQGASYAGKENKSNSICINIRSQHSSQADDEASTCMRKVQYTQDPTSDLAKGTAPYRTLRFSLPLESSSHQEK